MKRYIPYIVLLAVGICAGISVVAAMAYYRSYNTVKTELAKTQAPERRDQIALLQRFLMWYGIVEAVSVQDGTLTVRLYDQFVATAEPVSFVVHITAETTVIEQRLLANKGTYVGLSEEPGTFADISPGVRVAMLLENIPAEKKVVARTIMFGNPL